MKSIRCFSQFDDFNNSYGSQLDDEDLSKYVTDLLSLTRIPIRFHECTLEAIPDSAPHKAPLIAWRDQIVAKVDKGKGILLFGELGIGKTGAAVAMAKEIMLRHGYVWYVTDLEIDSILKDRGRELDKKKLLRRQCLILDDLGSCGKADFGVHTQNLEYVIRERYNHMLPVLATTNLTESSLYSYLGPATMSVLRAMCDFIQVSTTAWRSAE